MRCSTYFITPPFHIFVFGNTVPANTKSELYGYKLSVCRSTDDDALTNFDLQVSTTKSTVRIEKMYDMGKNDVLKVAKLQCRGADFLGHVYRRNRSQLELHTEDARFGDSHQDGLSMIQPQ